MPEKERTSYFSHYYGRPRYRGLGGLENEGYRVGDSQSRVSAHNEVVSQSTPRTEVRQFRSIAESGGDTVVSFTNEQVFVEPPRPAREFESTQAVHLAAQASSRPMTADNEQFFRIKAHELDSKLQEMHSMMVKGKGYQAPNKETEGFMGAFVRWFVECTVRLWRLNRDAENRMRFTRALQNSMHMLSAIESFLIAEVLKSHDSENPKLYSSRRSDAFKVRNTFRVFVQQMKAYDRLYHWSYMVSNNRMFEFLSQIPILSTFTSFPPSENQVGTMSLALNSMLRNLFEGTLMGRRISGHRQALVTDNPNAKAQNLTPESCGFETANRQQHGTYIGRRKTQAFRMEHRLQVDESIVRTFQSSPEATLLNNGVENVLSVLQKHWKNLLFQDNGSLGHHREELLNPIHTLRFHMPIVLVTMTNLRGRNRFDSEVVGPLIRRLESFDPVAITSIQAGDTEQGDQASMDITKTCNVARSLVNTLLSHVVPICASIPARVSALRGWLEAILESIDELEVEAHNVRQLLASVDRGTRIGYQVIHCTDWQIPDEQKLEKAVLAYLKPRSSNQSNIGIDEACIQNALDRLGPRNARTLQDLIRAGHHTSKPAQLLIGRTITLLHRELRRKAIDRRISQLSYGEDVFPINLIHNHWYFIQSAEITGVFKYKETKGNNKLRFTDLLSGNSILFDRRTSLSIRQYIPVAESISRAQKAYMTLEIEFLKRFSYSAFMEFGSCSVNASLRSQLRRLAATAQLHSFAIDNSRRTVLCEFLSKQDETVPPTNKCPPQNLIIIGGGPAGLITAIHSIQSSLMSGGKVSLYESRGTYQKDTAAFERAQVVRLDATWLSLLRFHLGTAFEDTFVPLRGETDAHLGNTFPFEGFAEVTIKLLERLLHDEAIQLQSRGLMKYYTGSGIKFDVENGLLLKTGFELKPGDNIRVNNSRWRVYGHVYPQPLKSDEVEINREYDILFPEEKCVGCYRLVELAHDYFASFVSTRDSELPTLLQGPFDQFQVFMKDKATTEPTGIALRRMDGQSGEGMLDFNLVREQTFPLDVFDSHVLVAAGQPSKSDEHFPVTSSEPYGVCCIEGLKVSMIMHSFGQKRFNGFEDDLRSLRDQNTRLIGDFMKSVALPAIVKEMSRKLGILEDKENIRTTFTRYIEKAISDEGVSHLGMVDSLNGHFMDLLLRANRTVDIVSSKLTYTHPDGRKSINPTRLGFQRQRLQIRYFEVGDNHYLGMELPREFEEWKYTTIASVVPGPRYELLREKLRSIYDRLWFEATITVVNEGDVFNPDARAQLPSFSLIPSLRHELLGEMGMGTFTLASPDKSRFKLTNRDGDLVSMVAPNGTPLAIPSGTRVQTDDGRVWTAGELGIGSQVEPVDVFEVLCKLPSRRTSLVRTSNGHVCELSNSLFVWQQSDLSRSADGLSESQTAISTFPVSLHVSSRTMRILHVEGKDGYIAGFIGDAQASAHFMRYSALAGACANAVSMNNFLGQAVAGISFADRVKRYAQETNWSNGEVIGRGTGHNFGEDGFLRPAFTYRDLVEYVYGRANEQYVLDEDLDTALTRDWKNKISSGLVPRGLEADHTFRRAVKQQLLKHVRDKFIDKAEEILDVETLPGSTLAAIDNAMESLTNIFLGESESVSVERAFKNLDIYSKDVLQTLSVVVHGTTEALKQCLDYAFDQRTKNGRVSSEFFHQPKPVDSFIDDYAIEAQAFASGLTRSVAFAAGSVALGLLSTDDETEVSRIVSIFFSALNILTSFDTMANVSRYRNRNEDSRVIFFDEKLPRILKGVFSLMSLQRRQDLRIPNPFVEELESRAASFYERARYYDHAEEVVAEFRRDYQNLVSTIQSHRSVVHFISRLVGYYIADKFQANPYLQEELVEMYKTLNEMLHLMRGGASRGMVQGSSDLYKELLEFRPKLEQSLQRGTIVFGFLKRRSWKQWSLFVSIRYILSGIGLWRTMSTETLRVLRKLEKVSEAGDRIFLRRELRDFQELYYAGRESEITSLLFSSATIVFYGSFAFTIFRLIGVLAAYFVPENENLEESEWVTFLLDIAGFATVFSIVGATLATFHQWRKITILSRLHQRLGQGRKVEGRIQLVRYLTRAEQVLSLCRILITLCAGVSLVWSLLILLKSDDDDLEENQSPKDLLDKDENLIPVIFALSAVFMGAISLAFYFLIELSVRYGLDPNLGPTVLEPFVDEISALKRRFIDPRAGGVGIETQQNIELEVWEYTAREFLHHYRFDTIFTNERFGSLFQYLQGAPRQSRQQRL